ncbi:MAG: rhodanese-like domain-containing protein [Bacteroidetes bacterium]|nr:rhodanese-like domain-containing protein [Bacteroidota bacterium]MBS1932198.1 rhodanese-like domain-containing protein [Bacteroidota bacterium]
MKKYPRLFVILLLLVAFAGIVHAQTEPWKPGQLMQPKDLVAMINDASAPQPLIFNIGPAGLIKNAIDIGPVSKKENFDSLKSFLAGVNRDREIVIYCGCCPFKNCPNIRPAFKLLNEMNFANQKLLNLTTNLKTDWINHNYPMATHQ